MQKSIRKTKNLSDIKNNKTGNHCWLLIERDVYLKIDNRKNEVLP